MHISYDHFNLIPAEAQEIAQRHDSDCDDSLPPIEEQVDLSDDETYVDKEVEDIEIVYDESKGEKEDDSLQDTQFQETRSGRHI
jgi:hypothetical protein